jgi:hypothetical protein
VRPAAYGVPAPAVAAAADGCGSDARGDHDEPPSDQAQAIAAALLEFGSHHDPSEKGALLEFTANEKANALLKSDPFAFLLGVLFDQNVPAERAWIAPFLLKERLGHLDPEIIAHADVAVRDAVQQVPKLHRYVEKMPRWIVRAAQRVLDRYGGDASTIWSDRCGAGVHRPTLRGEPRVCGTGGRRLGRSLRQVRVPPSHRHRPRPVQHDVQAQVDEPDHVCGAP